jgi:GntR family transcriptional regulator
MDCTGTYQYVMWRRNAVNVSLDKSSSRPLYAQLEQAILGDINAGRARPGDRLPSERELAEAHGISRQTVRQTINQLVLQGILYRQPGKGTYVRSRETAIGRVHLTGITRFYFDWAQQTTVWHRPPHLTPAPDFVAALLQVDPHSPVVAVEHVQYHRGMAVSYVRSWILGEFGPSLLAGPCCEASILDLLLNRCDLQIAASRDRIEPATAGPQEAEMLTVPSGSAVQRVTGCFMTAAGRPVEAHRSLIRAERFHLEFEFQFD